MPYIPPSGDAADFFLTGGYTAPPGDAADFDLGDALEEVIGAVSIEYSALSTVLGNVHIDYGLAAMWVVDGVAIEYGMCSAYVVQPIDVAYHGMIQGDCEITLPATSDVAGACQVVYGLGWEIVRGVELAWAHEVEILAAVDIAYSAISPVISSVEITYNMETMTPVLGAVEIISLRAQEGETVSLSWALEVAGVDIQSVAALSMSRSMDQYAITVNAELLDGGDYLRCPLGSVATLSLAGESIALVVVGRGRPRSPESYRYTITMASPAALLDAPWADTITGDYSGMAASIAGHVAGPVTWHTIDWPIISGRLQVSGQTPLAVLRQISGAVEAVVVSEWDGSVTVEPHYPVSVVDWPRATPGATISDATEVFQADESEAVSDLYDTVLVGDGQAEDVASGNIQIEVVDADDGDGKIIRSWCHPWNSSLSMSHAGGSWVQLSRTGDETREETEVVTITSGEGSCRYPVSSVVRTDWRERNLGGVLIEPDGRITSTVAGDSLLEVSYRTRARVWRLRNSRDEEVLVVAEADDKRGVSSAVSTLIVSGQGSSRGPEVQDPLLCSDAAARERGRNLLDASRSPRATVTLTCPLRSLLRPGMLVEVLDIERPPWRGLLRVFAANVAVQGDDLTATATLTIEREVDA